MAGLNHRGLSPTHGRTERKPVSSSEVVKFLLIRCGQIKGIIISKPKLQFSDRRITSRKKETWICSKILIW